MKRKQTPPAGDMADANDFPSIADAFPGEWEKIQADRRAAADAEREWFHKNHEVYLASRRIPEAEWQRIIDRAVAESRGILSLENPVVMREAERWLHPVPAIPATDAPPPPMSDREKEVYVFIRDNGPVTTKQIETNFGVEPKTLDLPIRRLRKRYNVKNRRGVGYYLEFPNDAGLTLD